MPGAAVGSLGDRRHGQLPVEARGRFLACCAAVVDSEGESVVVEVERTFGDRYWHTVAEVEVEEDMKHGRRLEVGLMEEEDRSAEERNLGTWEVVGKIALRTRLAIAYASIWVEWTNPAEGKFDCLVEL